MVQLYPGRCEQFRTTLIQKLLLPSFATLLKDAEELGLYLHHLDDPFITWMIPSSIVKLLSKNILNTKMEWFKENHIERLAIDGQDLYSSATFTYSTFLRMLYTSQKPLPAISSNPLPRNYIPSSWPKLRKRKLLQMSLRSDTYEEIWTMLAFLVVSFIKSLQ